MSKILFTIKTSYYIIEIMKGCQGESRCVCENDITEAEKHSINEKRPLFPIVQYFEINGEWYEFKEEKHYFAESNEKSE